MKYTAENKLFELHATKGLPLSMAMMLLNKETVPPNLAKFWFDAMLGGWTPERAFSVVEGACRDNEWPYDYDEFKTKLAIVSTKHNHDWSKCSEFLAY